MSKFSLYFFLNFLVFLAPVLADPPGWYNPVVILKNIEEFHLTNDTEKNLYVVYSKLLLPFKQENPQNFHIELKIPGRPDGVVKISEVNLKPFIVQFSVNPTVAVSSDRIMVTWQRPSLNNVGMTFEYAILNKSDLKIIEKSRINISEMNTYQPAVYADIKNTFHIFYQKRLSGGKTSLSHVYYDEGKFRERGEVIKDIQSVGRGAFFPSIDFYNGNIHVVFQTRQADTLTDELFYVFSKNSGASFSSIRQITKNNSNDFSPYILAGEKDIDLIWESNEEGNWQIFYSRNLEEPEKITNSLSNCYQPKIGYSKKNGKVAVWLDQRVDPGQIFAKFLDKKNSLMSKEHQVTFLKNSSINPELVNEDSNLVLIFLNAKDLYQMKIDEDTSPIIISSPTHPPNTIVTSSDITLNWKLPNEPSGVDEYAYIIDNRKESIPDFYNLNGDAANLQKKGLSGGNYYFHLKYKDKAGNESPVFSYPFTVDSTNPVIAEVFSSTHKENSPESKHDFKVSLNAVDDIGIKGFNYTLTTNRGAPLNKFTDQTDLLFTDLEDGFYYFLVQAVDLAGRTSPVVSYRINIVPEDYNDFIILHNITEGRVTDNAIEISLQINVQDKKLSDIYSLLSKTKQNPFQNGSILEKTESEGIYKATVQLPLHQWGLYTLSLGLTYDNGSKSTIRNFFFEYFNEAVQKKIQYTRKGKGRIIKTIDLPGVFEGIIPIIELFEEDGLFKLSFSLPDMYKKLVKGFTYQVSDIPSLPDGEMNYVDNPVYLFDLQDGIYYISVKPVFINEKSNTFSNYSYLRFEVDNKSIWNKKAFIVFVLIIFLLTGFMGWKHIKFYLSKFR